MLLPLQTEMSDSDVSGNMRDFQSWVKGSNPFYRSKINKQNQSAAPSVGDWQSAMFKRVLPKWLRRRIANPLSIGSSPVTRSKSFS